MHSLKRGLYYRKKSNNTDSANKYNDNSTVAPIISESEMDVMSSGDEYDAEPMSTDMLEDICDRNQYRPSINSIEAHYNIHDCFKQRQAERKGALLSTHHLCKCLHKIFKSVVNELSEALPIFGELVSEVSYFIP